MKPGDSSGDLFDGLAASLLQQDALPELGADKTDFKELAHLLRETPKSAVPLIKGGLSQAASEYAVKEKLVEQPLARLVLVIDQFEEMFTHKHFTHEVREKFIEAIDALARSGRVWVITTLRSDFYPRTAELRGLVALKEGDGQYDLLSPAPGEIGQMIRQPAQLAGLHFEEDPVTNERLDDVIRDAAIKNPGALPLLEFTLEELYKQRTAEGVLTFDAYRKLGGVEGALAQRAEEVYRGLEPAVQKAMDLELHFLISIEVDDGEKVTRKYALHDIVTATPETKAFVEAFVQARLFTTDLATDGSPIVYISHEALLQHWPRLKDWIEENRELIRIRSRVNTAATEWLSEDRSKDLLYTAKKQVSDAELLRKNKNIELTESEQAFVNSSLARSRRMWWFKRAIAALLVILTVVAAGTAYMALQERDKAKTEARTAEQVSDFLVELFKVADPSESLGDTITARELLDRGAMRIETELADQPEVQTSLMNTMGNAYRELGLYDDGIALLEKSLERRREAFGKTHPGVATGALYLAGVYLETGNHAAAEPLVREALAIRKKRFGDSDSSVAYCLNDLGYIMDVTGRDSIAEIMYTEALNIRRELYGKNNRGVATGLNNLGFLAYQAGDYPKAAKLFEESLSIRRELFGEVHPKIAIALNNLAVIYNKMGDHEKSEQLNKEALEIRRKIYGDQHPQVAQSLNNLGKVFMKRGEYEKAGELYEEALQIRRNSFGNEHADVANSLYSLGNINMKTGHFEKAEEYYEEAFTIQQGLGGDQYKSAVSTLNSLAEMYVENGDLAKAEEVFFQSLEFSKENLPSDHYLTAVTMEKLGSYLSRAGRYDEAEVYLLESYAILEAKLGNENDFTQKSLNALIELYSGWDKPGKVTEFELLMVDASDPS
jgi:tetratricopeptide (TPR) repeat protein